MRHIAELFLVILSMTFSSSVALDAHEHLRLKIDQYQRRIVGGEMAREVVRPVYLLLSACAEAAAFNKDNRRAYDAGVGERRGCFMKGVMAFITRIMFGRTLLPRLRRCSGRIR